MAVISKTAISLRLKGDDLQPEEISIILGCQPDVSAAKGGSWHTPNGAEHIAKTGMWRKEVVDRSPGDLDGQVTELLELMNDDLAAWQRLTTRFNTDLFCGIFLEECNEGIELSPKILFALGARGIKLGLDIYGLVEDHDLSERQ